MHTTAGEGGGPGPTSKERAAVCRRSRAVKAASMPLKIPSCSRATASGVAPLRSSSQILPPADTPT